MGSELCMLLCRQAGLVDNKVRSMGVGGASQAGSLCGRLWGSELCMLLCRQAGLVDNKVRGPVVTSLRPVCEDRGYVRMVLIPP